MPPCSESDDEESDAESEPLAVALLPDPTPQEPSYIIVGDNMDRNITPRDVRVDNQVKSFHHFNFYAVPDRVNFTNLCGDDRVGDVLDPPFTAFLPSPEDCSAIRSNYIILAARVVVEKLSYFSKLAKCVPGHIEHRFPKNMAEKSSSVPLGVIPKNENKGKEMNEIMKAIHSYIPSRPGSDGDPHLMKVAFGGDQLTAKRARNGQLIKSNSDTEVEALQGLVPFASDCHAEVHLLQVFFSRLYKGGSNNDGGTLVQLRNLVNRRSVGNDNASIDFFEMATKCYIVAAAMAFFVLTSMQGVPTTNALSSDIFKWDTAKQWKRAIGRMIDQYVIVRKVMQITPQCSIPRPVTPALDLHAQRVALEHAYCGAQVQNSGNILFCRLTVRN